MDYSVFLLDKLDLKYSVRDAVHGFVYFNEVEKAVIDHPWFQRLRYIKQLAFTDYVYPGATHTRFEHSLGVMHLATRMFLRILSKCKDDLLEYWEVEETSTSEKIEGQLVRVLQSIRLAALMHDIGHGPFSHAFELLCPVDKEGMRYSHEDYSVAAIEALGSLYIEKAVCLEGVAEASLIPDEVVSILTGRWDKDTAPSVLLSLCRTIISSQLDADRLDYLLRDSHHAGVAYGVFDLERILESINIVEQYREDSTGGELALALDESDFHVAETVTLARFWMWYTVYLHKTRRIFDLMLAHAIPHVLVSPIPKPDTSEDLYAYMMYSEIQVLKSLTTSNEHQSLPLHGAITKRMIPRCLAKSTGEGKLRKFKLNLDRKGIAFFCEDTFDGEIQPPPRLWIDTGLKVTPYKAVESEEILLREDARDNDLADSVPLTRRLEPKQLSQLSHVINSEFLEKEREPRFHVYGAEEDRALVESILG